MIEVWGWCFRDWAKALHDLIVCHEDEDFGIVVLLGGIL
jgi:hypothetical protein